MKARAHLILVLLATLLSGCVGDKAEYVHSVWRDGDDAVLTRDVYFVTDREPDKDWPGGFGKHWADKLACGSAQALIPQLNRTGEPVPTGKLGTVEHWPSCGENADGLGDLIGEAARGEGCGGRVLVYVHGFNTLFDGAVLRAGQMALDTRWPASCPVVAFSWASEGEIGRYVADIEHSAYATPELEAVLRALWRGGAKIDIVGHSIGARLALASLASMRLHGSQIPDGFVDQMILAAADVGAKPENNDFAHLLLDAKPYANRITVYASRGDAVLAVSAVAHGDVPRAGRRPLGDRKLQDGEIDVVDATDAPAEPLGHSYFALSSEAVRDIAMVLQGVPIEQRLKPPQTLICVPPKDAGACESGSPHYLLIVAPERRPDFWVRLVRALAPLIPRIELSPLTGSPE